MIGEVVETSASFEARFRATTLPDRGRRWREGEYRAEKWQKGESIGCS